VRPTLYLQLESRGIVVAALLIGNTSAMVVFTFGLVVAELIIWPLAFLIGAVSAAIGAGSLLSD
jgi:hypothetical protein